MVTPKVEREAEARNYGKFVISPLERGFGVTLGNALRRVESLGTENLNDADEILAYWPGELAVSAEPRVREGKDGAAPVQRPACSRVAER